MSSKSTKQTTKASSTKVEKAEEYNEKEIQAGIETLVNKVFSHTLRGTSLDAKVPDDSDAAEKLYQQYRVGFSFLSQMDDYIAGIVDQLAKGMHRLTENRFKQTIEVEQEEEPAADENIVDNHGSDEEDSDAEEEKKSTKKEEKKGKKSKKESEDEEEPEEAPKKAKTPKKVSKAKEPEPEPEPESESEPEEEVKPKKGDKKTGKK